MQNSISFSVVIDPCAVVVRISLRQTALPFQSFYCVRTGSINLDHSALPLTACSQWFDWLSTRNLVAFAALSFLASPLKEQSKVPEESVLRHSIASL